MFDVAIIGMSGRFPEAEDIMQFWENIKNGRECITNFTDNELRAAGISERDLSDSNYVKASGTIKDIEMFDASFFGFTSREAELTDPQQRIFLECAWEALENAGYVSEKFDGSIGVFGGVSNDTYLLNNIAKTAIIDSVGPYPIMIGNAKDFLCTRVSYKLNLKGPSITVQTACSTSLVAVHMACQSLLNGECDMALAGGASIRVPQKAGYKFQDGGILSPDGKCRPFDENANGTLVGDGVGIVVLKLLTDALHDGDHIYSIIKGTAMNNDGSMKVGFTAPSVEGQAEVINEALNAGRITPDTIGYIEAHGTATKLGDPIEVAALKKVFSRDIKSDKKCVIGSVKGNIGHLDVAAGIAGLIKATLMLDKKILVPSINYKQPNRQLLLENSPFYVNTEKKEWISDHIPRRAGVSSFGLGGTNAHVVLEEYLELKEKAVQDNRRTWHIIPWSAKNITSITALQNKMLHFFDRNRNVNMQNVSYTLTMGRKSFSNRLFCVCRNADDFINTITNKNANEMVQGIVEGYAPTNVFIFPEITIVHKEFFTELYNSESIFRDSINACCEIVFKEYGLALKKMFLSSVEQMEANSCCKNVIQFSFQYALANIFYQLGIKADIAIGQTIGKYILSVLRNEMALKDALLIIGNQFNSIEKSSLVSKAYLDFKDDLHKAVNVLSVKNQNHVFIVMGNTCPESFSNLNIIENHKIMNALPLCSVNDSALQQLLTIVGELWVNGCDINWDILHKHKNCKRIPIPTYCFDKKKYWISAPESRSQEISEVALQSDLGNTMECLDIKNINNQLKKLCSNLLGINKVSDNDTLFELCEDSFVVLQLNNDIQKHFNIHLPIKNIIEGNTISKMSETIFNIINHKLDINSLQENSIVKFKANGSKSPIFLIHPAGGTVMGYNALVKHLPNEYPVYGIQYTYKDKNNADRTIQEIADDYIKLITSIQPEGAIILGGHSFGGNVAFEIATKFKKIGRNIEHLIMFDSHPPSSYYCNDVFDEAMFLKAFPIVCAMFFNKRIDAIDTEFENLDAAITYLKNNEWIPWGFDNIQFHEYYNLWRSNHNSLRTHMPEEQYTGSFVFFRAQIGQPDAILDTLNIKLTKDMDIEEWGKLSSLAPRFFDAPGSHYTMLDEPNVRYIADVLNKVLA